jgi:PHD/YefM family antitoxin component YafN of YafNO toxin-antitoxin module
MTVDDLDSIEATIELLRDPAAQRRVVEATAEIELGEWLDEAAVRAIARGQ